MDLNILFILSDQSVFNKNMLESLMPFIKSTKSSLFFTYIVEVPLKYPIDSEDKDLSKDYFIAEKILKDFQSDINLNKISSNQTSSAFYRARDLSSGIIGVAKEKQSNLIIIPELIIGLRSTESPYFSLRKIISKLGASIMIWKGEN